MTYKINFTLFMTIPNTQAKLASLITGQAQYSSKIRFAHHGASQISSSRGFSLVETMVAITILLMAVVGPMSVIGGSLAQIATARNQVVAINLAQEGIEVVRQKRDSNMLARWNQNPPVTLWSAELSAGDYIVDSTTVSPTLFRCVAVGSCNTTQISIYQDILGMYHQYSGVTSGTIVQFTRVVNIADNSLAEKKITSTVKWTTSGGIIKIITVSVSIFGINS